MKFASGIIFLVAIYLVVKIVFGLGQGLQEASFRPVASDDPRLVVNGGDCAVILTFPPNTPRDQKAAEATLYLVNNKSALEGYQSDELPNGDQCFTPMATQ